MRSVLLFLAIGCGLFAEDKATRHTIELDGAPLEYVATVGTFPAYDRDRVSKGEIAYMSFVKEGKERPVTFCFNGGPGSASLWLNIGAFGPRRIIAPEEGQLGTPPYPMIDNLETILDLTDLVFIDPMGTGYSHLNSKEDGKIFYGVKEDIESVGSFIRDYIAAHQCWNSPKYLAGESYGTARACGVAAYLQNDHGMYLNGLILISCAIDFQTFFFGQPNQDNQLPFFLFLPTYAATSWYHDRYRPEATLQEVVEEAVDFSYQNLVPALFRPSSLGKQERAALYRRISQFSGINEELVRRFQGKIYSDFFLQQFLANEDKVLGGYDTRCTGHINYYGQRTFASDPSVSPLEGIMSAAFQNYLQKELDYPASLPYRTIAMDVNANWNFFSFTQWGYPNLLDSLRNAMLVNPSLKVFVGSGYYDCVTPFAAADYCFDHLSLPEAIRSNIDMEYYEGGHMYYLNPSARVKFKQDLIRFYK